MTSVATNAVWATSIYSDPNDAGSQWIMLVGKTEVGFYGPPFSRNHCSAYPGTAAEAVELTNGLTGYWQDFCRYLVPQASAERCGPAVASNVILPAFACGTSAEVLPKSI